MIKDEDLNLYDYGFNLVKKYTIDFIKNINDIEKLQKIFILPYPTGSGKSTSIAKLVKEIENDKNVNFIYVVHNRQGRDEAYEKLKSVLDKDFLKNNVLVLKEQGEHIKEFYKKHKYNTEKFLLIISKEIFPTFYSLSDFVKKMDRLLQSSLKEEFKKEFEEKFTILIKTLKQEIKLYYKINKNIPEDLLNIFKILFPTISLDKKVIILTMKKFLMPLFSLQKDYYLYQSKNYIFNKEKKKKTILFIDEFDTQYREMLSHITEESTQIRIEKIDFLRDLTKMYTNNDIKKVMIDGLKEGIKYQEGDEEYYNHLFQKLNNFFEKELILFINENNLKLKFSIDKEFRKNYKYLNNYMFGYRNNLFFLTKNNELVVKRKDNKNFLKKVEKINENEILVSRIIQKTNYLFNKYIYLITQFLSIKQQQLYNDNDTKKKLAVVQLASNYFHTFLPVDNLSLLNSYSLGKKLELFIKKNQIIGTTIKTDKLGIKDSIYTDNLSLTYMYINELEHPDIAYFYNLQMQYNPNIFLYYLSEYFFIIGSSATALIPSKIHNFDLEFLEEHNKIIKPTQKELKTLISKYQKEKLNNKEIKYDILNKELIEYIEDKTILKKMEEKKLEKRISNVFIVIGSIGLESYYEEFKKIENELNKSQKVKDLLKNYIYFMENSDIDSYLYMTPYKVLSNDLYFFQNKNKEELLLFYKILFLYICVNIKILISKPYFRNYYKFVKFFVKNIKNGYLFVFTEKFKNVLLGNLENINKLLFLYPASAQNVVDGVKIGNFIKNNKRIFLLTNHKYAAKGQNFHYKINNEEKDIEVISTTLPTHLFIYNLDEKTNKEAEILALYYDLLVLREYGVITTNELFSYLRRVMRIENNRTTISYKNTMDYIYTLEIFLIQIIGRALRTNTKQKLHIILNEEWIEYIKQMEKNDIKLSIINNLIEYVSNLKDPFTDIKDELNKDSKYLNKYIRNSLSSFNQETTNIYKKRLIQRNIKEWQKIRNIVLKYPSITENKLEELSKTIPILKHFYFDGIKKDKYYFKIQEIDYVFTIVDISLNKKSQMIEFSREDSGVDKYIEFYPKLKKQIGVTFNKEYKLNPIAYINFYKGAIGEIIGKAIVEEYINETLLDLNNSDILYESFDYILFDNIYFDFKNYSISTIFNNYKTLIDGELGIIRRMENKLNKNKIQNSIVFVINILQHNSLKEFINEPIIRKKNNNKIVIIPSLLEERDNKIQISVKNLDEIEKYIKEYK